MKQIISISCLALLFAFATGCKKNNSSNKTELYSDSIVGTWELRRASAAMNPEVAKLPAGNGHILKFSGNGYERYEAGVLVKKGQYAVLADPTVESSVCLLFPVGEFTNRVVYDGDNNAEKQFIQITNNRLVIVAGCYAVDAGHRLEYERITVLDNN